MLCYIFYPREMADLRFEYRKMEIIHMIALKPSKRNHIAKVKKQKWEEKVQNHSICLNESHKVSSNSNPNLRHTKIELALCGILCSRFVRSSFFFLFAPKHETSLIPLLDNLEREEMY